MARTVQCVLLKREAEGLERAPYPGELGRRIYEQVSKEAWGQWLRHQTLLINEYRLHPDRAEGSQVSRVRDGEILLRGRLAGAPGLPANRPMRKLRPA